MPTSEEDKEVYARARAIAEHASGMPAYMCDDELWYGAVDAARAELGIREKAPVCRYCGDVAPYGDERNAWISVHQSIFHRLYYSKIKEIHFLKSRKH